MLGLATKLLAAAAGARGPELFVPDDRGPRGLANLVEGPIRQFDAAVADREPTIRIIDDGDPFADRRIAGRGEGAAVRPRASTSATTRPMRQSARRTRQRCRHWSGWGAPCSR